MLNIYDSKRLEQKWLDFFLKIIIWHFGSPEITIIISKKSNVGAYDSEKVLKFQECELKFNWGKNLFLELSMKSR